MSRNLRVNAWPCEIEPFIVFNKVVDLEQIASIYKTIYGSCPLVGFFIGLCVGKHGVYDQPELNFNTLKYQYFMSCSS